MLFSVVSTVVNTPTGERDCGQGGGRARRAEIGARDARTSDDDFRDGSSAGGALPKTVDVGLGEVGTCQEPLAFTIRHGSLPVHERFESRLSANRVVGSLPDQSPPACAWYPSFTRASS